MDQLVPQSDLPTNQASQAVPDNDLPDNKYETTGQEIKTGLEGAAEGVAGPLATAAETHLLGVKPEDIAGRRAANPGIHAIGQTAGLVGGSMIPGLGEYSLGSKIAEAGAGLAGVAEVGSYAHGAIKAASEMALLQSADETSKWLMNDPNQSMQSAIANIGLSGVLGAVGGAVFTKAGNAVKSLGEAPEQAAAGLRLNLDPLKANEPLFPEGYAPTASSRAVEKSYSLGERIGQAIKDNAPEALSESGGATIGAALGHMTGIPGAGWAGALLGERTISPMLKSIIPAIGKRVMDLNLSPEGFLSVVNAAEQAIKGKLLLEKAAQSVFGGVFTFKPVESRSLDKLDEHIKDLQNNPQKTIDVLNNNLDHYAPEHAQSLGQTVGQSINYLNSIRPNDQKQSPLDSKPVADPVTKGKYNQALTIAEDPLSVMQDIKNGTLTSHHIAHLAAMYPALYDQMKTSLMQSMTEHLTKQESVPYKSRLGLSLFFGEPLDSSMKPQSIQASIPAQPQQIPGGAPGVKNQKHSTQNLSKFAELDATPGQAKAMREQKG